MSVFEGLYDWLDRRFDLDDASPFLGKAFPAEDSFLLGEIALFCFVVLALTGIFLGFFFEPSTSSVAYQGSVARYQGQNLPASFVSVLYITYDIPYGMFLRRMHHWAAHLFVASIGLHLLRVYFTGAYRNPRETNWLVGGLLALAAIFAAYTGYSLPFDEFASTATGIGYSIARSIPVVGDLLSKLVFGGQYPSSATVPRFYFLHVFFLPAVIAVLLLVHMAILVRQKHTEARRDSDVEGAVVVDGEEAPEAIAHDDDSWVVGLPAFPNQTAVSAVVFFLTLATLSVLAGFLPVHNVAAYGPNDPASTPTLIMPDWFLMWVFGFLKLMPAWLSFTIPLTDVRVTTEFIGGMVLPGLVFLGLFAWPFIDYRRDPTGFTVDPLSRPRQTAVGVAAVEFIMIASIAGMNNIVADVTGISTDAINALLQGAIVLVPVVAGVLTYYALGGFETDETNRRGGVQERVDGGEPTGSGTDSTGGTETVVDSDHPDDVDGADDAANGGGSV